ncbi:MAG TPA: APC family permease [Candidatus Binatus sp.]|nr:APC family permease [Candidatus Binatus sp.]
MPTADNPSLNPTEAVQSHSAALRKELRLFDLVLAQILIIIVPEFFGTAVKAGNSHVALWIFAIVLFFIPHAFVVAHLNRLIPLEGGLYEWARIGFNDRVGFLTAWNMWLLQTIQVSQIALVTTTYLSYAAPGAAWIASNSAVLVAASVTLIAVMMLFACTGLRFGKWVSNAGSFFTVFILSVLILLPYFHVWTGHLPAYHPLPLLLPPLTLFSLSVFSKMTFGALSGFETVAIFAGESHNPARNIARSILISAPIIAILYILGTSAILAFVSPDAIDVIGPVPQAITRGFSLFGKTGPLASIVVVMLLMNYLSSYTLYFSANARLPLVAGWDRLLPNWFTPLHPKYRTPVNSILFMGGVALAASVAVLIGAGNQESFTLLQTWAWTFYGLAYLVKFAIPLLSRKDKGLRPGLWLQLAAASGFLVTLLFVVLSVLPVIPVASVWKYSLKVIVVVVGANLFGWMIYRAGQRKGEHTIA